MAELKYRSPKGVHDVLPADHQYMTYIKKAVRHRARQAGYKRIDPPIYENRAIFERGIGAHTDIVEKELFLVSSKQPDAAEEAAGDKKEFALRPEFTAGICRAYIEHGMQQLPQPVQRLAGPPALMELRGRSQQGVVLVRRFGPMPGS